eukprot:4392-Heterococcus_DN1.PRE.2
MAKFKAEAGARALLLRAQQGQETIGCISILATSPSCNVDIQGQGDLCFLKPPTAKTRAASTLLGSGTKIVLHTCAADQGFAKRLLEGRAFVKKRHCDTG